MFGQIYLVILAMEGIQFAYDYVGTFSDNFKVFFVWECLEAITPAAAVLGNGLFLLIRSLFRQQTVLNL